MPRLSLYRPEKSNNFKFIDKLISQQFQVGGTDLFIHKYSGVYPPSDGTTSTSTLSSPIAPEMSIQDVIFMENRDRKYEPDVYCIRGIHTMQDLDFNLSQFGLFFSNDNIFIFLHLRDSVNAIGRKIMSGDVVEVPHLKDEYALDDSLSALRRFFVVQDVMRPSAGFSQTWYPHLLRIKCKPIVNSQEFKDIFDSTDENGEKLRDVLTAYQTNIDINDQIIAQADLDVKFSGYDTRHYYILNDAEINLSDLGTYPITIETPTKNMYVGYLTGDGYPPNGLPFSAGQTWPVDPTRGEYFLRTDYMPNRMFRFNGTRWEMYEDKVRMILNNYGHQDVASGVAAGNPVRHTQKGTFINNNTTATIGGEVVSEKQMLSKVLKPRADL